MFIRNALIVSAIIIIAGGLGYVDVSHASPGQPLVYTCNSVQGQMPTCTNAQEFEVFDHNSSPIFSIGESGGASTFGDNLSVYGTSVFNPSVVISFESPQQYGRPTCAAPEMWIDPKTPAIWTCSTLGTWIKNPI